MSHLPLSNRRRFMGTVGALCATTLPLAAIAQSAPLKLVISCHRVA